MVTPYVPIPFFPPYEHWRPSAHGAAVALPVNKDVRRWLDGREAPNLLYLDLRYCTSFLEMAAHSWRQSRASELYELHTRVLERMLNWSYLHGYSILSWGDSEFGSFLKFVKQPPEAWCSPARYRKFIAAPLAPFSEWKINEKWRPFCRRVDGANGCIQTRGDLQRSARVVGDFFDYYITTTEIEKDNFAKRLPDFILKGMPLSQTSVIHSPYELDWVFEQIEKLPALIRRPEQILLYLAIARFSVIRLRHARYLSQFFKSVEGTWHFNTDNVSALDIELSVDFCINLERSLVMRGIDVNEELPTLPCFPTNDGVYPYSFDALQRHMVEFSVLLADAAAKSDDPLIAGAKDKFRHMTFSSVRSSSECYSISRRRCGLAKC